jgi:signal transduction histidine kinase
LKKISITRLSHLLIGYMILAFSWWAYHLWQQNELVFATEQLLIINELKTEGQEISKTTIAQHPKYPAAKRGWEKRRRIVVYEGLFFICCLVAGLYIIRRSADREVSLARQRRNFLLSITHELKSPIAGMRLAFDTIKRRELNREQYFSLSQNGVKDAVRLQQLVEDLLLAARLEDDWRPYTEPFEATALARECIQTVKTRFPDANIIAELPEGPLELRSDKTGLASVIQNLLENAVKYAPISSPIVLKMSSLAGKLQLRITDEGPGIPDAEKKAVFEKFYRLGNEETRSATGTGLGLYIVKQVVESQGGKIQLYDNQPSGAIFDILI